MSIHDERKQRMREELQELEGRLARLEAFIYTDPKFQWLVTDERQDLHAQRSAMRDYRDALKRRVERAA